MVGIKYIQNNLNQVRSQECWFYFIFSKIMWSVPFTVCIENASLEIVLDTAFCTICYFTLFSHEKYFLGTCIYGSFSFVH